MPVLETLDRQRQEALKLDTLRPWDLSVDPQGRPPLRPFPPEDTQGFVASVRKIFEGISPRLAFQFDELRDHGNLDLESRPGKRPGGFQSSLEASRQPFIFMNAADLQRDVETLLHEGGHAFHYQAASTIENCYARHAPLEFCEVASMSMELIGAESFELLYDDPADAGRARRLQLEGVIRILPWVATIDGFQHWLYTHPGHSRAQRTEAWNQLLGRFSSPAVDYAGHEAARDAMWHRQVHLFAYPFYYIEYGIAQLGAAQVWLNYRQNPKKTLAKLLDAFALGGTVTLPALFQAAGLKFDFSLSTIQPVVDAISEELANLPA